MTDEKKIGKEAPEICRNSDSSTDLVGQEKVCGKDDNSSRPVSLLSSPYGATSLNNEDSNPYKDIVHGARYPLVNNQSYFLGYGGSRSRWEDMGQVPSRGKIEGPHLRSCTQPVRVGYGYHHSDPVPPLYKQEQHGYFPRSSSVEQTISHNGYTDKRNEKYNSSRNFVASSEQVRGPRADRMKSCSYSSTEKLSSNSLLRKEQFNKSDFQIKYEKAKFFLIKSYSEDDIHKSIKYSVWASTPNGNKKLDAAFSAADMESKENGTQCPIFLFFSVNSSGQFLGLAEMTGRVDYKKSMWFWQQDKWNGFFPVTWHIVKDIPNRLFQDITLENNGGRAVTFSRDTQEIFLPQGLRMLFIFKNYQSGTSILDDFEFYEKREISLRTLRDRRHTSHQSDAEFNDKDDSVEHLEAAFGKVGISARPRNAFPHPRSLYSRSGNPSWSNPWQGNTS